MGVSEEKMAHDTASHGATTDKTDEAATKATVEKKDLKKCPQCRQIVPEKPAKTGPVDIDAEVPDEFNQLTRAPPAPAHVHKDFVHCVPLDPPTYRKFSVFTAGSIEMGRAVQWQKLMAQSLSDLPITILNPRRGNWDPNVTPEAKDKAFAAQVVWELEALHSATVICFFFDVTTMSPITLLELGLWAQSRKIVVCCGEKYWRNGNVEIVCKRYGVPFVKNFEDLVPEVRKMLVEKGMKLNSNGDLDIEGPNEPDAKADAKKGE
jgi:hypothetical protein